jgi:hypothetical protein
MDPVAACRVGIVESLTDDADVAEGPDGGGRRHLRPLTVLSPKDIVKMKEMYPRLGK